ncbi:MAG: prolyl oligopeptidase family serine peptidase [Lachnospiraceae bacterium]|nr:prolyl oligopeptidase family serine peptidase [Lachnospiraceae bacterium]
MKKLNLSKQLCGFVSVLLAGVLIFSLAAFAAGTAAETPAEAPEEIEAEAEAEAPAELAELEDLEIINVAQTITPRDFKFVPGKKTYNVTVVEDDYAVLFTPTFEEGEIIVTSEGLDGFLCTTGTDLGNPQASGKGEMATELTIQPGDTFFLTLTQKRMAAYCADDVAAGKFAWGMEMDQDYTVTIQTAKGDYTINIHRPNSLQWASKFKRYQTDLGEIDKECEGLLQDYWLYVPEDYDEEKEYPLVLILHGGGQRLNDAADILLRYTQTTVFPKYGKEVIVLAPQAQTTTHDYTDANGWGNVSELTIFGKGAMWALKDTIDKYSVDTKKLYVGGCSMGGMGTMAFLTNYPDVFAGAIINCGGASVPEGMEPEEGAALFAEKMKDSETELLIVHAVKDPTVLYERGEQLMDALDEAGKKYEKIIYDEDTFLYPSGHFSWTPAFNSKETIEWLLAQERKTEASGF